jgi:hypothetical protein
VRDVAPAAGAPEGQTVAAPVTPPPALKEPPDAVPAIDPATVASLPVDPPIPAPVEVKPAAPEAPAASSPPADRKAAAVVPPAARPAAAVPAGRYAVQLASVTSKRRAQAEGVRLGKRLSGILGGREPTVVPAEIAGRGTVYRIRVPGFASRSAARRACARIKAGGGDCMVVRN